MQNSFMPFWACLLPLLVVGVPGHVAAVDVCGVEEVAWEGKGRHIFHVDGDLVPLLASPNIVAGDCPTVVMEANAKCTSRLHAFSCGANGEPDSNCSRVAIPAGLLDGVLGTYTAAGYSVILYQVA